MNFWIIFPVFQEFLKIVCSNICGISSFGCLVSFCLNEPTKVKFGFRGPSESLADRKCFFITPSRRYRNGHKMSMPHCKTSISHGSTTNTHKIYDGNAWCTWTLHYIYIMLQAILDHKLVRTINVYLSSMCDVITNIFVCAIPLFIFMFAASQCWKMGLTIAYYHHESWSLSP